MVIENSEEDSWNERKLKLHTRRLSIKEGIVYSAKASFGDNYVTPFAISLGTSNPLVVILNSLWNLGSAFQLLGAKLPEMMKRKKILTRTIALESFGWLLFTLIAIAYFKNFMLNYLPYFTLFSLTLIVFAIGLGHPSWFSWMGEIVDSKYRGRWFSKRSTILSFTTIILSVVSAIILTHLTKRGYEKIGFIILFSLALLSRTWCVGIIRKHYEPKNKKLNLKKGNLKNFLKNKQILNFKKFAKFRGMFAIVMGITSPLISIYLLKNLGFSYGIYMAIMLSGTFFSILTLNMWGKLADKYGNYRVIILTAIILQVYPLLWTFSKSPVYLFFVPALIGGVAWSGFFMASRNFIYDNISSEKRNVAISYFNLFIGIGALIGGFIGALLIKFITFTWIEPIIFILIIGTILRIIVVSFWIPKISEIKNKRKRNNFSEIKHTIIKEAKPTIVEDFHEIAAIPRYMRER